MNNPTESVVFAILCNNYIILFICKVEETIERKAENDSSQNYRLICVS